MDDADREAARALTEEDVKRIFAESDRVAEEVSPAESGGGKGTDRATGERTGGDTVRRAARAEGKEREGGDVPTVTASGAAPTANVAQAVLLLLHSLSDAELRTVRSACDDLLTDS